MNNVADICFSASDGPFHMIGGSNERIQQECGLINTKPERRVITVVWWVLVLVSVFLGYSVWNKRFTKPDTILYENAVFLLKTCR